MKLLGKEWSYIGEGNAHIVLHLKGTEFVLRFNKEDSQPFDLESAQNTVNYVNLISAPLLFNDPKFSQEVVTIPLKELQELCHILDKINPENRRFKSVLSQYAIKTLNLTLLNLQCETNYCIEIKPKEGFICKSLKTLSKCFYCLKQYLKMEMDDIREHSSYCPLDLFSGNKDRMARALMNLIDNPQNNVKLFENGKVIYDAESTVTDFDGIILRMGIFQSIMQFLEFIIEILLKDEKTDYSFQDMFRSEGYYPLKNKDECIFTSDLHLFPNSIMYKLLRIQRHSEPKNLNPKTIGYEGTEYVKILLNHIKSKNLNLYEDKHRELLLKTLDAVQASMLSAIAKDCSIMICFTPNYIEGFPFIKLGTKKIPYRLALTDLEPKMAKSLVKRKEIESRIIELYKIRKPM